MTQEVETFAGDATKAAIAALSAGSSNVFSTIQGDDFETRARIFDAVSNSTPLADLGVEQDIQAVDFVVQSVDMTDEKTGEVRAVPRSVIVAADGRAYHAISNGVFRSIETMIGILGQPSTWPVGGVAIRIEKGGAGQNKWMALRPAPRVKK